MDNLRMILLGFLALLVIILIINMINAVFSNSQRKRARNTGRDRMRGDMDRVSNDYRTSNNNLRQRRSSSHVQQRNRSQAHQRQRVSSASHAHY